MVQKVVFPSGTTNYIRDSIAHLAQHCNEANMVMLTDAHVAMAYPDVFAGRKTIVLPAGEELKSLATIEHIFTELISLEATRSTTLVGVGGGVITDIAGFAAATYMRGIASGFVPTTVLAMVDAALGGKNGVNTGLHKNIAGTIKQPGFILFDTTLLATLPQDEWSNGFAEVIKYGCIFDEALFSELERHDLAYYRNNAPAMDALMLRCADWKNKVVIADEHEKGERKLLNFGHTAAHAIENLYHLPHGQAVAIGMVIACRLSEQITGLPARFTEQLEQTLIRYGLPTHYAYDTKEVMQVLAMDKKRVADKIDYILLEQAGRGMIRPLNLDIIEQTLQACAQ